MEMNNILYSKVNNHNKPKIEKQELWSNLHLKKTTEKKKLMEKYKQSL